MQLPLQITFRNMEPSDSVEALIREEAAELESFYDKIMGCRVVVEVPHRHHVKGNVYRVRIDLTVPGGEVVVKEAASLHTDAKQIELEDVTKSEEAHTSHRHAAVAVREAFEAARRRLQDYARRQRGQVKREEPTPRGHVVRLFPEEGYGFLETPDGREIYFHRNSVLDGHFDCLEVGTEVIFAEESGEKGSQASTVRLSVKHLGH